MIYLNSISISNIKGVGPKKEKLLNNLNIYSIKDILEYAPRDYQNLKDINFINQESNEKVLYKLEVISQPILSRVKGNMTLLKFQASDGQSVAEVVFFNQEFLKNKFLPGKSYYFLGNVKRTRYGYQLQSPELVAFREVGKFKAIYNLTSGLSNNELNKFIIYAFNEYKEYIIDYLPDDIKKQYNILDLRKAIRSIHYPSSKEEIQASRSRIIFDELFILQITLDKINGGNEVNVGPIIDISSYKDQVKDLISKLPFQLTNSQSRAVNEILEDMSSNRQMNRLLQGDVGSGKTIVAAIAIYISFLNGYLSVFMAPTEILASQQYNFFLKTFSNTNMEIKLLTGSVLAKEREEIYSGLKAGKIDLLVGTHALIQDEVKFKNLALTITDEQHRFGVKQRQELTLKGNKPHNLVMTATPIPRTLAHVFYGTMDVSIIDELPKDRKEIKTIVINDSYINRLDDFIISQVDNGNQVYIVCPLIDSEDKENIELRSIKEVYDHYRGDKFKDINVSYVHGNMANVEKNQLMSDFLENKINVLVSTTVIEVGINVPNASLMIIYDADRFGLSQLHQLRGRVGRGKDQSYCVLINNNMSEKSIERMKVMRDSNDGFYIAEKDLQLRGEGDLLGYRQHGMPNLKIANLVKDSKIIEFINNNKKNIIDSIKKDKNKEEEFNKLIENKISLIDS